MPARGTVFQVKGEGNHFWIVISGVKNGNVLAVNVTDEAHCPDSPCKLNIGDHPRITKPSVIYYWWAREFNAATVDAQLATQAFVRKLEDCSPALLARIVEGARKADDLKKRFLEYLK
jgi:hypothetical protein